MFSRAVVLVGSLLLTIALVSPASAEPNMQEGEWEITTTMEMPGLPFAMPPIKSRTCITKENMVPQSPEKGQECTTRTIQNKGNQFSWEMECKDKKSSTLSKGTILYQKDSFSGTIESAMKSADGTQVVNQQLSGRRIGPCK